MRAIDYSLRVFTLVAAIGCFFLPESISWKLLTACFFAAGLWSILFPSGALGWVRRGHRNLDPSDMSLWWIPRLIGACLLGMSIVFAIGFSK